MKKICLLVILSIICTVLPLMADPAPTQPTVEEIFTPEVISQTKRLPEIRDELESTINQNVEELDAQYTAYQEAGCEAKSKDRECSNMESQMRENLISLLESVRAELSNMKEAVDAILPNLRKSIDHWKGEFPSSLHDEIVRTDEVLDAPEEFSFLQDISDGFGLEMTQSLLTLTTGHYDVLAGTKQYIDTMLPQIDQLIAQARISSNPLSELLSPGQKVRIKAITKKLLPRTAKTKKKRLQSKQKKEYSY
ncbi:hypothetical protein ACFL03_08825 [Thermodesulfobacteriota bacterium]